MSKLALNLALEAMPSFHVACERGHILHRDTVGEPGASQGPEP